MAFAPVAVFEVACDESSDVFVFVFFVFGEFFVFVLGEVDCGWVVGFCGEVLQGGVGVGPAGGGAGGGSGDFEFTVFHWGSPPWA